MDLVKSDISLKVWTIADDSALSCLPEAKSIYAGILPYIDEFLTSKHPYRKSVVCPFVPAAIRNDKIYFAYCDENIAPDLFIEQCISYYINSTAYRKFGAMILIFPKSYKIEQLLDLHLANKQKCVAKSLMLGALWPQNQAQSLHSKDFFPLRTPTPILVIRDITVHDLTFMDPGYYNLKTRLCFLNEFINTFNENKSKMAKQQVDMAKKIKQKYQRKLNIKRGIFVVIGFVISILLIRIIA